MDNESTKIDTQADMRKAEINAQIGELNQQINEVDTILANLIHLFQTGKISPHEYKDRTTTLTYSYDCLEKERHQLLQQL